MANFTHAIAENLTKTSASGAPRTSRFAAAFLRSEELPIIWKEAVLTSEELPAIVVDENELNKKRLDALKQGFTRELLAVIEEEDFEYGVGTKADILVKKQMSVNALATKEWLNSMFVENFSDASVLVGLLRIIARLEYPDISLQGQTMALAALSHEDTEVKECGVRAFESWGTLEGLFILRKLNVSPSWLQEYIDEVIANLKKDHNVSDFQEN